MEGEGEEGRREREPEEDPEKEKRRALEAVFGECSDSDDDGRNLFSSPSSDALHLHHGQEEACWDRVEGIRGLWLCRGFLSPERQVDLLSAIEKEGWFSEKTHNQAMRFGDLPMWATDLSNLIQEAACLGDPDFGLFDESLAGDQDNEAYPLPGHLLWRDPLFDQLIVNVYEPGNLCTCGPDAL